MKETFDQLKQIFPPMPEACDRALTAAVQSVTEKREKPAPRLGRLALLAACMLAVTGVAAAALYPQIVTLFSGRFGQAYGAWMAQGSVAAPQAVVTCGGAVFTVDEVLVRGRGLYVMGTIAPEDGFVLADADCGSAQEPWGYNTHYGETAPEGAPTIAQKAAEDGRAIRYVQCDLRGVGVDGGETLMPGCWGYSAMARRDGSFVYTMEVEDGMVVEPGSTYTLALCATVWAAGEDDALDPGTQAEQTFSVTVAPQPVSQP